MVGAMADSLIDKKDALEFKFAVYIVLGIIAIVVINLLLDGIRKAIRGLDTAALGALLLWIGHKTSGVIVISAISGLLYLIGGTLVATGLVVFILLKLFRRKRAKRRSQPSAPPQVQEEEKEE